MPAADSGISQAYGVDNIPDHSECMKKKIELLMKEGKYSQEQAVAIAYKHCGETQKSAPNALAKMGLLAQDASQDLDIAHNRLVDETEGAGRYASLVDCAKDPDLKKLLQELSGEELGHAKRLTAWIEAHKPAEEAQKSAPKHILVEIAKVSRNVVYGVVLKPGIADLQGDIMSPDDIQKACHEYMAEYRTININHAADIKACPVECWITKEAGKLGDREYPAGSWLMGTRIDDPEVMRGVHEGLFKSYSIEGEGTREPLAS